MKVISLPRGGLCVFADDGSRMVVTRDAEGRLWVDHGGGRSVVDGHGDARADRGGGGSTASDGVVRAPAGGRVAAVLVEPGASIAAGAAVAVVELMKAEVRVPAPCAGRVAEVHVEAGATVARGAAIASLDASANSSA